MKIFVIHGFALAPLCCKVRRQLQPKVAPDENSNNRRRRRRSRAPADADAWLEGVDNTTEWAKRLGQ